MKRKGVVGMMLFVTMVCLIPIPVMAIPTISLTLDDPLIEVGDLFNVRVLSDADGIGEELLAFGFDVSASGGSVFSYDGYLLGPRFDDESFGPGNVTASAFPGILDDDVLLATLSFAALAEGTDRLTVQGIFDGMFSGLYYEFTVADVYGMLDITVAGTTVPVPEPTSMVLLGSGLLGLAGFKRKLRKN